MNLQRALATNSTATSYAAIPCLLQPNTPLFPAGSTTANAGVFSLNVGGLASHDLEIMPFGAGAATDTANVRVVGWRLAGDIWVPTLLCDLAVTLGAAVGLSTSAFLKGTDFLAKTITATTGLAILPTVTADTPARAIVNCYGFDYIQIQTNTNSSATNVNALIAIQPTHRSEHKVS